MSFEGTVMAQRGNLLISYFRAAEIPDAWYGQHIAVGQDGWGRLF